MHNFLIVRSENTILPKPKRTLTPDGRQSQCLNITFQIILITSFLSSWLIILLLQRGIIKSLLQISGIEPNPGPELSQQHKCIKNALGICPVSHTCEVEGFDIEIFAACHCGSCEGFGPLLCYNHFLQDSCRRIRTKSNQLLPITCGSSPMAPFRKSPKFDLSYSSTISPNPVHDSPSKQGFGMMDKIECTTCFRLITISNIGISHKCWKSLLRSKGYFHYTCTKCLANQSFCSMDQSMILNMSSQHLDGIKTPILSREGQLSRIIVHKRRKISRHIKLTPAIDPLKTSLPKKPNPLSNLSSQCLPLMSLVVKPPPVHIVEKWRRALDSLDVRTVPLSVTERRALSIGESHIYPKPLNFNAVPFYPLDLQRTCPPANPPMNPYINCFFASAPLSPRAFPSALGIIRSNHISSRASSNVTKWQNRGTQSNVSCGGVTKPITQPQS